MERKRKEVRPEKDLKDEWVRVVADSYYRWAIQAILALALRPSEIVSARVAGIDFNGQQRTSEGREAR
jgi:integrase